jgi:hypothetical protein
VIQDLLTTLKDLASVAGFLLAIATAVYTFFATRRAKVDERFKAGSDRMDRHELRLHALEQTVQGLPSREDIHKIELSMSNIAGTMGRMEAVMEGNAQIMQRLETIVTRHEDHLLNGRN